MKNRFTAIIEKGEKYLIATCPEVPEAAGPGLTREDALQDLAGSIQGVLEYRRDEALSRLTAQAERTVVEVP
jgi:predicted RNase H-like HicB family nuclease